MNQVQDKIEHIEAELVVLSVTECIHLNWGDEGLITLFSKIWRLLHPDFCIVGRDIGVIPSFLVKSCTPKVMRYIQERPGGRFY
ncbi:hypothetical protein CIPAW_05G218700 [Carya illinoinensis]|uniref:RNA methyltransferase bin3 C-terminal domain-containing protein n=1 Tax=Carya illinoinensis TaxID=32201 RepID=A0A8T1QLQ8_CARIL|nr:hypothetical protein CIPAW_05G218700 [Carya illinoinensis]